MRNFKFPLLCVSYCFWSVLSAQGYVLTKVYDFPATAGQPAKPYSIPVQIGDELWFTTEAGGTFGFGTLAKWDLNASSLTTAFPGMNTTTGNTPQSFFTPSGGKLYFTTTRGGTGDRGVLASYELSSGNYTVLWSSPSNSPAANPNTLTGNPIVVDRGTYQEVYFMTRNGGNGTGFGTIQKYNSATHLVTQVAAFTGAPDGRQPFGGFTQVGTQLYFTTFTGGITGTGYPNGAGTLMKLDLDTDTVSTLVALPSGDGSTRFAASNPLFHSGHNAIYFVTSGTSTEPGALLRFDLSLNLLTTLYELAGAPTAAGPFPDGRFIYSELACYQDSLFFTTIQGGAFGGGTLNRFDLSNNQFEVLFNLGNDTVAGVNWGSEARGGPVVVTHDGEDFLYLLTRSGGTFNQGTLLQVALIPESSTYLLLILATLVFGCQRTVTWKAVGRKR